jgi:cob(I)alamin adenosyltransferase
MGRFRKTLFYAGQALCLPVVQYESDAEKVRREQLELLREQTGLLRQKAPAVDRFAAEDHERARHAGELFMARLAAEKTAEAAAP